MSNFDRGKELVEGSSPATPSRYESQKRRDWNTFGQATTCWSSLGT
uniref:ALOG domain-containing protein n=1 Tax=Solanum lycopersicum TaxID=4081 RepID=A0A3Q7HD69_SOLLC